MEIALKYRLFVICFCAVWMQIGGIFVCVPGFGKSRPHLRGKRDMEVPFRIAKAGDAEKNAALRKIITTELPDCRSSYIMEVESDGWKHGFYNVQNIPGEAAERTAGSSDAVHQHSGNVPGIRQRIRWFWKSDCPDERKRRVPGHALQGNYRYRFRRDLLPDGKDRRKQCRGRRGGFLPD